MAFEKDKVINIKEWLYFMDDWPYDIPDEYNWNPDYYNEPFEQYEQLLPYRLKISRSLDNKGRESSSDYDYGYWHNPCEGFFQKAKRILYKSIGMNWNDVYSKLKSILPNGMKSWSYFPDLDISKPVWDTPSKSIMYTEFRWRPDLESLEYVMKYAYFRGSHYFYIDNNWTLQALIKLPKPKQETYEQRRRNSVEKQKAKRRERKQYKKAQQDKEYSFEHDWQEQHDINLRIELFESRPREKGPHSYFEERRKQTKNNDR